MKRSVYVIWHDKWHPDTSYEAMVNAVFGDWDLKTDKSMRTLVQAEKAPDLAVILSSALPDGEMLTTAEQETLCRMAENGAGFLYIHAGLTRIEQDSPIYNLTRARFIMHPSGEPPVYSAAVPGVAHPLAQRLVPFEAPDEHYFCFVDAERTQPFMFSRSIHGTEISGWAHGFGKGRVCCLTPGHNAKAADALKPMVASAAAWCLG